MFCPKCGSKALDGATFCQKCGANLIVDDTVQQAATSTPVQQTQPSTYNGSSDTPKKKKLGKLPIILGAVALVIVLIIVVASSDRGDDFLQTQGNVTLTTSSGTEAVNHLKTYMNEADGISFKYPDFWEEGILSEAGVYFSDDSMTMIMYLLAPTVDGPKLPVMNIRKAPVTQDVINSVFSATLSTLMPEGNMMATEIEDVAIGDLPGRKFTFATKTDDGADITIIRYIYFINSLQYRIEFYGTTSSLKEIESFLNAIMESYTITTANTSDGSKISSNLISYKGISIGYLLESTDDVISLLGDSPLNDELKLRYDDMEFYHDNGAITSLESFDPSLFEANGITLNKNRDGLIKIFGEPSEEGDGGGGYFMSYNLSDCSMYFELGEPASEAWRVSISPSATTESVSSEVIYKGIPVKSLLEYSMDEATALFGEPTYDGAYLQGYTYEYNNEISFIFFEDRITLIWITISPEALTVNDVSLDKDRAFLIETFGEPTDEGVGEMTQKYEISYDWAEYALNFTLPDSSSKISAITIYPKSA